MTLLIGSNSLHRVDEKIPDKVSLRGKAKEGRALLLISRALYGLLGKADPSGLALVLSLLLG